MPKYDLNDYPLFVVSLEIIYNHRLELDGGGKDTGSYNNTQYAKHHFSIFDGLEVK